MEEISTYSISKLQKALELSSDKHDYFFVDIGREPLYTDEPFRTETFTILLLKKGEICFSAGLTTHIVTAPSLIAVAPTVTRSFTRTADKPEMELIFFTEAFLVEQLSDVFLLSKFPFFEDNDRHISYLCAKNFIQIGSIFKQISAILSENPVHERPILRHLLLVLVYQIDLLQKSNKPSKTETRPRNLLFQKFRNLLTKEFLRHRSVNYYADALNVTPKYLSQVVKRDTGMTAGEWIDKAVLLEAKVLLQNNGMNISQISDYLNFSDQSFFGKYFKNLQGISPLEYRRSLE